VKIRPGKTVDLKKKPGTKRRRIPRFLNFKNGINETLQLILKSHEAYICICRTIESGLFILKRQILAFGISIKRHKKISRASKTLI
jgi:hypothetical protein